MRTAPELLVCGLGPRPELDATLEALEALSACRVVFACGPRPVLEPVLRRLEVPLRYDALPAEILAAARRGRVGAACVGHAVTTSPEGAELLRLARKEKRPCRVLASVSPIGAALARAVAFMGGGHFGWLGAQAISLDAICSGRLPRAAGALPVVVFRQAGRRGWAELAPLLAPLYPRGHRIRFFPAEGAARELALCELDGGDDAVALIPAAPRRRVI